MATLVDGIHTVALAATPTVLSATAVVVEWLYLAAHEDNTGVAAAGASTVVASDTGTCRGVRIPETKDDGVQPLLLKGPLNLKDLYIGVATNADSIYFFYKTLDH